MFKTYFARSILAAFGDLLNFDAPVRPYNISTADEINRSAWEATGKSMRAATDRACAGLSIDLHPRAVQSGVGRPIPLRTR